MLMIVYSTQRRYRTSSGDKEELLSTLSLGIRSSNLKHVQLQLDLADVAVHPGHHQMTHGLGGGGVHPVGSVLLAVTVADILEVAANTESRSAGSIGFTSFIHAILTNMFSSSL